MKKPVAIILIVLIAIIISLPLVKGFPQTHDGQNHLARIANYYLAFKQGQIPPRWAPNLNTGFGYPVLNFNYPLANILAIPLIVMGFNIESSLKIIIFVSLLSSGLGMFYFLRQRFTLNASLAGSVIYLITPYQLLNIFVRGNIGETLSFALLPWVLLLADRFIRQSNKYNATFTSIILALFLISHNLIALLSIPMIALYLVLNHNLTKVKKIIQPVLISLLLISFFWIPALAEKGSTIIDTTPLNQNYFLHFPQLSQLLFSAWDYGFSATGPVDGLSFQIGIINIIAILIGLILFVFHKRDKLAGTFLFIFFVSLFIMLPISLPLWRIIKPLSFIQFPWRLLFFTTFSSTFIASWIVHHLNQMKLMLLVTGLAVFLTIPLARPQATFSYDNVHWFNFPLTTTVLNEYNPKRFQSIEAITLFDQPDKPNVITFPQETEINILKWTGTNHQYSINTNEPSQIVEKTVYFPGWQTKVNGQLQNNHSEDKNIYGLINFEIPAGESIITTSFTQNTPSRIIGNLLSVVGFTLLLSPYLRPIYVSIVRKN